MARYDEREHDLFWTSLDELDALGAPEAVAQHVRDLVDRAVSDPKAVRANRNGLRIVKAPPFEEGDVRCPGLRLAYALTEYEFVDSDGFSGVVTLFHVRQHNEATDDIAVFIPKRRSNN